MNFNAHSELADLHAFLSPSSYHWLNYSDEKLINTYTRRQATERGTLLHALACDCIRLGVKVEKNKKAFNMYINDAIGFKMKPEQPLFYSVNAFGTADSILFRDGKLRIHDLKTGDTPCSMHQLEIYAALFCLEYRIDPATIAIELRIYQKDEIVVHEPEFQIINDIMKKIVEFDKLIEKIKQEE